MNKINKIESQLPCCLSKREIKLNKIIYLCDTGLYALEKSREIKSKLRTIIYEIDTITDIIDKEVIKYK
jgi:hypothetical protein